MHVLYCKILFLASYTATVHGAVLFPNSREQHMPLRYCMNYITVQYTVQYSIYSKIIYNTVYTYILYIYCIYIYIYITVYTILFIYCIYENKIK